MKKAQGYLSDEERKERKERKEIKMEANEAKLIAHAIGIPKRGRIMKDTYWFRYFLIVNAMSNRLLNMLPQNFAKLILEERAGRFANAQMTAFFDAINFELCDLLANDDMVFEENDIGKLAKLEPEELAKYYNEFCLQEGVLVLSRATK